MCGIAGILEFGPDARASAAALREMCSVITHRGPDDEGFYTDGAVGIGMRRLSIVDVAGGHQPISNEDGTLWLVFNGEIYNFLELRKVCEKAGDIFTSQSDTEVILALYRRHGVACLQHLRGMFAFALWDAAGKYLFFARDRLGKKPFNYSLTTNQFTFASEIDALVQHPGVSSQMDHEALELYLQLQYVPAPWTIYKEIRKLPPAHFDWKPHAKSMSLGRLALHVAENLSAQVIDQALADPRGEVPLHDREECVEQREPDDDTGQREHHTCALGQDALVDDQAEQYRVRNRDHGVQRGRENEDREIQPVRACVPGDPADRARLEPLLGH